ncbi:glycosyltransferase [Microbacterium sp.]|jgi:glycosyltransferase involved in cell wall biosynthesis|uniref:glycosyltransferase n=1 Tax=Microbacterium sp. TaxID=51671 RepID=UPI0037C770E2
MRRLRVCLIASSRFPVREPFAGGLEAHIHALARSLRDRGHEVSVFAAPGSDPALEIHPLDVEEFDASSAARADVSAPPDAWMREHHAYLSLMISLARSGHERFDVVHNNSLHHLPVAMASTLSIPMVTTLHTPPTPWLESALKFAPTHSAFAAVSEFTAEQWRHVVDAVVVRNGIDLTRWPEGPGGTDAVWFGRIVPEKAPHLAIDAARRAGIAINLAGPVFDNDYFAREIEPRLGSGVRLLGHLHSSQLSEVVRRARVTVLTPRWEEPYGLVAAESMASGTPVAAFARGGLTEVVGDGGGFLAGPDDVDELPRTIVRAAELPRAAVRAHAMRYHSLDTMVAQYESIYTHLASDSRAA